ncbi:uncharacterized protein LOC129583875 [Paramacrobiotus metropolitanus]|uniref:uncharacterized protein LOC129583875 n=1 Tax=Paramacrobiotus metropolitanus TaxID=2943436 RepID=UPI002446416D|nr:uncharacterized protein LOC129583875 [Paramacrobiotus metropolitanus]
MKIPVCSVVLLTVNWVVAHNLDKRQALNPQNPGVWQALDQLRGSSAPSAADIQRIMANAVPGRDYPMLAYIPQTTFSCSNVRQPGFYADPETRCQVFRRCEANNYMFSYICPNTTIFNQITLVCDYWYNVNCPNSQSFVDYSNPRIYIQNARLLDDVNYGGGSGSGGSIGPGGPIITGGGGSGSGLAGAAYTGGQISGGGGSGGSIYNQNSGLTGSGAGAYTGSFSGSLTQPPSQTNLPYGTMPLQQTTYPSAIQYTQYNSGGGAPQQPIAGYNSQPGPNYQNSAPVQPSYRSLSNRLLKLQADASDRIHDVVAAHSQTPLSSPQQTPATPTVGSTTTEK